MPCKNRSNDNNNDNTTTTRTTTITQAMRGIVTTATQNERKRTTRYVGQCEEILQFVHLEVRQSLTGKATTNQPTNQPTIHGMLFVQ
jgi:hypothetical protein